ncbi:MAG: PglZ domain-containing protein [Paludibacteraceae bacterium]|nr:PglZ domain-containing protein [Paludibacteraceae bacterium]
MTRILWADDEIDLLQPYVIYLNQKGYQVLTTNNGRDAIDMADRELPDIVFLDEQMPGLSGLEALQTIKDRHPSLPVVMITKSEEEGVMEQAIGQKIADYLIKPVNPSQILLCLKKHVHEKTIVTEQTDAGYRQEFSDISYLIDTAATMGEWQAVQRILSSWEIRLQEADSAMQEMLAMQRTQANAAFAKFVQRGYLGWLQNRSAIGDAVMSTDVFKRLIFPSLDKGEKLFLVVIDNFRYDQWKTIEPLLAESFNISDDRFCTSILPTATQYARNAIFSGLMPLQIKQMFPEYWVDEDEEEGKNLHEEELIRSQIERYRRHDTFSYFKVNESDYCEKLTGRLRSLRTPLNVVVLNFIDMLSHSRTESKMMRELAGDEAAYRSLTLSWFRHSPTYALFKRMAELGYKVILTSDHGTIRVTNPVQIVGDKNTNTNLRYKVGKALACKSKDVFVIDKPEAYGLPSPNLSSSYVFCTGQDFFGYPNNFNYYAQYYTGTFQHGGISLEEMLVPLITLEPK